MRPPVPCSPTEPCPALRWRAGALLVAIGLVAALATPVVAEEEAPAIPEVRHLLEFIKASERGITF